MCLSLAHSKKIHRNGEKEIFGSAKFRKDSMATYKNFSTINYFLGWKIYLYFEEVSDSKLGQDKKKLSLGTQDLCHLTRLVKTSQDQT